VAIEPGRKYKDANLSPLQPANPTPNFLPERCLMRGSVVAAVVAAATLLPAPITHCPAALPGKPAGQSPAYDGSDRYAEQQVEGWKVLVNKRLLPAENRRLRERALKLLGDHLYRITRVIPAEALAKLRKIPVWVELAEPHHPCMCYHPSADWLREHGMNPQKAGAVEIANARTFLTWTHEQPWMVLHELAHGYHDQVLGFDNAEVRACYASARAAKLYDSVLHYDGRKMRAYALTNEQEYFAEATEAYFGTNDFYPFVQAELKEHDPRAHALLTKLWGVQTGRR
jgi:hypothetical protein